MSNPNKIKFLRYFFRKFPRAIKAVAEICEAGDKKHNGTVRSFLGIENGHEEYSEAMVRHIFDEIIEGAVDPEDDRLHAARIAWGALSRLEIMLEKEYGEPVDYQYEGGIIGPTIQSMYDLMQKTSVEASDADAAAWTEAAARIGVCYINDQGDFKEYPNE